MAALPGMQLRCTPNTVANAVGMLNQPAVAAAAPAAAPRVSCHSYDAPRNNRITAPAGPAPTHLLQMCAHSLLSCSSSSAACAPPYSSKQESKVAAQSEGVRGMPCLPPPLPLPLPGPREN